VTTNNIGPYVSRAISPKSTVMAIVRWSQPRLSSGCSHFSQIQTNGNDGNLEVPVTEMTNLL
jgi:hypothetical protein